MGTMGNQQQQWGRAGAGFAWRQRRRLSLCSLALSLALGACGGGGGGGSSPADPGQNTGPQPLVDTNVYNASAAGSLATGSEASIATQHSITLDGQSLAYTARAGHLLPQDAQGRPQAAVFYVAYTLDGATPGQRPVTFFYNGGPGSASVWLHIGSFGPKRLATGMPDRIKLGTVGIAAPETEIRLSPEGEILLRGPHVFMGYLNQPEKTAETVRDGWLHTGDVGMLDNEGYLRITDRMKDIIITAGGKNITPSEIENQLKFSPYISDAVVIGDRRKFLSCLVMIDYDNVAKYAQDSNVPFTDFASLCRTKEVNDLIGSEIEKVNANFARVETIKKFRLIEQQLGAEDEELTPTMKLRRKLVNEKYKVLIDGMYAEAA